MATKINYVVTVINKPKGLDGYSSPSYSSKKIKTFKNGKKFRVDRIDTDRSGIWYREVESSAWVLYKSASGKAYLKISNDKKTSSKIIDSNTIPNHSFSRNPLVPDSKLSTIKPRSLISNSIPSGVISTTKVSISNASNKGNTNSGNVAPKKSNGRDKLIQNDAAYPKVDHTDNHGEIWYDWTIKTDKFKKDILTIKKNLNIPSAYTKYQISDLSNTKFNRYKIVYPDYRLEPTMSYVVFTRPDLNLFDSNKKILAQISNDPQLYYIYRNNPAILEQLSLAFASDNKFIPLLTNQATALDIPDEVVDTMETGENWAGYKMQYAKSSIRSMTAGSVSVKFPETYDVSITQMFQTWCSYENAVYRGTLIPKTEYCTYKILDYACDIYYFIMDRDWTIKFWTVYYGAFPTNVNKSIFSYDMGSDSGGADVNVTFNYFHKLDEDVRSLVNFNEIGGGAGAGIQYKADIDPSICMGGGGNTWSGAPFVQSIRTKKGKRTIDELKFRFRVK